MRVTHFEGLIAVYPPPGDNIACVTLVVEASGMDVELKPGKAATSKLTASLEVRLRPHARASDYREALGWLSLAEEALAP